MQKYFLNGRDCSALPRATLSVETCDEKKGQHSEPDHPDSPEASLGATRSRLNIYVLILFNC